MYCKPTNFIPERDEKCPVELIDLSDFYTESLDDNLHHKPGNTLKELPKGMVNISGVDFDVRGVIQLAGHRSKEITTLDYPTQVKIDNINLKGSEICFLHASAWNIETEKAEICKYIVNYERGYVAEIPLIYIENIWDWWSSENDPDLQPAWKGNNERTTAINQHIRLFLLKWENLLPELKIESIELKSNCSGPGPLVAGITIKK